jgi:hypothetical protein
MEELTDLRAAVRRLTDRQDIIELIQLRRAAEDARDWATLRSVYTTDVVLDHTEARDRRPGYGGVWNGIDEVMKLVSSGIERHLVTHHMTSDYRVEIRGDEATAFCTTISIKADPGQDGEQIVLIQQGWDIIELIRTTGGWRIRRVKPNVWKALVSPIAERLDSEALNARRSELRGTYRAVEALPAT